MAETMTLREFSEKLGVKKPTVNARVKKLEKNFPNEKLTVKINSVIYLTETGLALLEKSFEESPVKVKAKKQKKEKRSKQPTKNETDELHRAYQERIKQLEDEVKTYRHELERKSKQIDQLLASQASLTNTVSEALKNSQILLNQEQSIALIDRKLEADTKTEQPKKKKRSLFSRLTIAGRVLKGEYD